MKQVVRWSNGTSKGRIVVHPALVEDDITAQRIERVIKASRAEEKEGFWTLFGRLCSQTESSEGLTWQPEQVRGLDEPGMVAAYDAFLKLPRPIWDRWVDALSAVEDIKDVTLGPAPLGEGADPNG